MRDDHSACELPALSPPLQLENYDQRPIWHRPPAATRNKIIKNQERAACISSRAPASLQKSCNASCYSKRLSYSYL